MGCSCYPLQHLSDLCSREVLNLAVFVNKNTHRLIILLFQSDGTKVDPVRCLYSVRVHVVAFGHESNRLTIPSVLLDPPLHLALGDDQQHGLTMLDYLLALVVVEDPATSNEGLDKA